MNVENYLFNVSPTKIKLGLKRTQKLLAACGHPEKNIFTVQLVGTNGKGSTAAMLAHILNLKYNVGLFTSPHLIDFKERIRINFKKISNQDVKLFLEKYKNEIKRIDPSFFEIMTVMSAWYFSKNKVDIAIMETGLGGRLDSVTACKNKIVGYTNIDFDHQHILGDNIKTIATEKALAMINSTQTVFSVKQKKEVENILKKRAEKLNINFNFVKNIKIKKNLKGNHQLINAALAQKIAKELKLIQYNKLTSNDIAKGIKNTIWPGRFQIIQKAPTIIYDVAHNESGVNSFITTVNFYLKNKIFKNTILICGFENNKTLGNSLTKLNPIFDQIICTETNIKKSMSCTDLYKSFNNTKVLYNSNIETVFKSLTKVNKNTLLCIIGSHYFAPYISKFYNKSFAKI